MGKKMKDNLENDVNQKHNKAKMDCEVVKESEIEQPHIKKKKKKKKDEIGNTMSCSEVVKENEKQSKHIKNQKKKMADENNEKDCFVENIEKEQSIISKKKKKKKDKLRNKKGYEIVEENDKEKPNIKKKKRKAKGESLIENTYAAVENSAIPYLVVEDSICDAKVKKKKKSQRKAYDRNEEEKTHKKDISQSELSSQDTEKLGKDLKTVTGVCHNCGSTQKFEIPRKKKKKVLQ